MIAPFISICIPVYNMSPYLRECLDSLRNQSFSDWEAVCTDDGSTDDSGAILDEYAQMDSRIKVIHQNNGGLCNARNSAMNLATGEWLWFMDADDALLIGALERFFELTQKYPYDGFCFTGYTPFVEHCDATVSGSGELVAVVDPPGIGKSLYFQSKPLRGLPFNRIVRRAMFTHVRFIDGLKYLEDSIQLIEMLSIKAKWALVDIELYGYRHRTDSISHGYKKGKCALEMASFELMFTKAHDGLRLTQVEFEAFVEQYRGSMQYYLYQGFAGEDKKGLLDVVAAYERLCQLIGHGHVSCFYEWRLWSVKAGLFWILAKPIRLLEYLYCGICRELEIAYV